jgi:hypothetical protein
MVPAINELSGDECAKQLLNDSKFCIISQNNIWE